MRVVLIEEGCGYGAFFFISIASIFLNILLFVRYFRSTFSGGMAPLLSPQLRRCHTISTQRFDN
jgi:hypothetical protein